jgi:hypothetical protein
MTDLELALRELDVEWPETPDLATAVRGRLEPRLEPRRAPWRRRHALAAAALALLFGGTMAVSPSARTDVLRWLGLKSVEIKKAPVPTPRPGASLNLGTRSSVADLRASGVPVRVPRGLGSPDVYATRLFNGTVAASLVYDGPILVQTFRASASRFIQKTVGSAEAVEDVTVDGNPGYFITGAHGFAFEVENNEVYYEDQRIAGNTLLVEGDGVLLRIEGAISKRRAVEIAESVQ